MNRLLRTSTYIAYPQVHVIQILVRMVGSVLSDPEVINVYAKTHSLGETAKL
ncbi:hypothetical protein AVEN_184717-1, partial [Araneus ventricosus]